MLKKRRFMILLVALLVVVTTTGVVMGVAASERNDRSADTICIVPEGDRRVTVEYRMEYQELGATALYNGTQPLEAEVVGTVNTNVLGDYLIKYTASYNGVVGTAYRLVRVVDSYPPVIELVSDPEYYTLPTQTYQEEGFTAFDNYDGDLTEQVICTMTRETVTYTVTDSSGNTTSEVRRIVYNDPVPPVITLKGQATMILREGQHYKDPGYTAEDNCDGDITSKVTVLGTVDRYKPGKYKITYSVQDSYGNIATQSRVVHVKAKSDTSTDIPSLPLPEGRVIYLTFDDGPGPYTEELLDVLQEYNVKATFFVVNTGYISVIKRAIAEGHSVGVHTASHIFKEIYASEDAYFADLYKMRGIIKELTGVETNLLRFPGGTSNTISSFNEGIMTRLSKLVEEKGFKYFDWNVDSKDAGGAKTAAQVYRNVTGGIGDKKYSVVLQHDIKDFSVEAVEDIIIWGLENGYSFLPLEEDSPVCHHGARN